MVSANIPIVRRIAWLYTLPNPTIDARTNFDLAVLYGALGYLVYSFGSKALLLRHHRRGMSLARLKRFREAIPEFQSSLLAKRTVRPRS